MSDDSDTPKAIPAINISRLALEGWLAQLRTTRLSKPEASPMFLVFVMSHEGRELRYLRRWLEERLQTTVAPLSEVEATFHVETVLAEAVGLKTLDEAGSLLHRAKAASTDLCKARVAWGELLMQQRDAEVAASSQVMKTGRGGGAE